MLRKLCRQINSKQLAKIITISCLVATVSCAHFARGPHAAQSQLSAQAIAAPNGQAGTDAAAKAAAQQAKLHYVEIGPSLKGDYKFGYDTGSGPAGQSFREETRLDDGTVKGAYGYVDANGKQRIVKYTAGKNGFVVEGDQEAPGSGQAAPAQAAPAEAAAPAPRRPQPVAVPQPQAAPAQPTFDEVAPARDIQALPTPEERARAEQQHAEQLRQHQLAQQAALAQQQQFAQRLQAQQQQQLVAEQQARARAQPQSQHVQPQHHNQLQHQHQHQHAPPAQPQHHQAQPHFATQPHQPAQHPQHQQVDPQTGSFFSSSTDPNLQQLLNNQLRQLQSGNQFVGQFQPPPQAPVAPQQQPHFGAQPSPAFQQPAAQFAQPQPQPPQDFSQFRAARQAANEQQFHQQPHQAAGPRAALLALHQQQQHDAQMLANLRAQQLARVQETQLGNRQLAPQHVQQAPPQFDNAAPQQQQQQQQQQPRQQLFAQPIPQHLQQRAPQQVSAAAPVEAAVAQPQPEVFGPPVIDIRTLNYSIGQQMRV